MGIGTWIKRLSDGSVNRDKYSTVPHASSPGSGQCQVQYVTITSHSENTLSIILIYNGNEITYSFAYKAKYTSLDDAYERKTIKKNIS